MSDSFWYPSFRNLFSIQRLQIEKFYRILSFTYVLRVSGAIGVLVFLGSEEVHVGDLVEERFVELASGTSLGSRGETLDGSNKDEGKDDGVGLHDGNLFSQNRRNEICEE